MAISHDGFTYYYDGVFYIYYNKSRSYIRVRFTLFHEIEHIILNHHIEFKKEILQISENTDFMESEANIMARNLIVPAYIIHNLYLGMNNFIPEIFQMNDEASMNRIHWSNKDYRGIQYKNPDFLLPEIQRLNRMFEKNYLNIAPWQSGYNYLN